MKALFEFQFRDGIYGEKNDEDISSLDYREMEKVVDGVVLDGINRALTEIYEIIGVDDLEYDCITNEDTNKFSYIVSTGYPRHTATKIFDLIDSSIRLMFTDFKNFTDEFELHRLAWKDYDDGESVECPHIYETVSFLAVGNDIREIQTCNLCKESIAKLVRLV